jgi:phosphoglycolate phosphatase-like HAD superfamily hydrolase
VKRLVLFDIDGTLVRGGPAKDAFEQAMLEVYGTAGPIEQHDFSGKTDPQIARELLHRAGFEDERIDEALPRLWQGYLGRLQARLVDRPMEILPGVAPLLDALEKVGDAALGLLTGNIIDGARLKLGSVGLDGRFAVGGYGSDHEVRNELPAIAIRRARQTWQAAFEPDQVVVVGDTPRDVECGKAEGTRTVAVATGRHSFDALEATNADHTLYDFTDTNAVLEVVLG